MIIGISGKIASGKSTLARAVAARLGGRRLAFGDYVRSIAEARGLNSSDRTTLQFLGQDLATRDPSAFVRGMLSFGGYLPRDNIVLDGVRHAAIWREVQAAAVRAVDASFLVFLEVPEEIRLKRLITRGLDRITADVFDRHASEIDLGRHLCRVADLTLNTRLDEEELVSRVVRFAEKL